MWLQNSATPPEEKEKNDIHASSQKKEREKKKGEVYGARHKNTMGKKSSFLTCT